MKESYEIIKSCLVRRAKLDPQGFKEAHKKKELSAFLLAEVNRLGVDKDTIDSALRDATFVKACNLSATAAPSEASTQNTTTSAAAAESVPARNPALATTTIRQNRGQPRQNTAATDDLQKAEEWAEKNIHEPAFTYIYGNAFDEAQVKQKILDSGWDLSNQDLVKEKLRMPRMLTLASSFFSALFCVHSMGTGRTFTGLLQGMIAFDLLRISCNSYFKQYALLCSRKMEARTLMSNISNTISTAITGRLVDANQKYFKDLNQDILLADTLVAEALKIIESNLPTNLRSKKHD